LTDSRSPADADVLLGRSPDCDCLISDPSVSRRHARIRYDGERWLVADLGSLNGTRLNGWRIAEETEVRPGDRLSLGPARFRLTAPR
jgi:pSer/pThr/pTyr-binding forkhead associated (FHA) protein